MFQKAQALLKTPRRPAAGCLAFDESSPAPGGQRTAAALAQAFRQKRDRTIRYVETTQDPLHSHVGEGGVRQSRPALPQVMLD